MVTTNSKTAPHEELQTELLAKLQNFRRLEGERLTNHLLRNLLLQSNKTLEDCGVALADELTDMKVQVEKARAEARLANQYANHFGKLLKTMSMRRRGVGMDKMAQSAEEMIAEAKKAVEWQPGQPEHAAPEDQAQERATH